MIFAGNIGERADDTETQIEEWLSDAADTGNVDITSFPKKGDYVIENSERIAQSVLEILEK